MPVWEAFPELTRDRLLVLRSTVRPIWGIANSDLHPERGDGPSTRGTMLYERTAAELKRLGDACDWVDVHLANNECTLLVRDTPPIKFAWDDHQSPKRRRRRITITEASLMEDMFGNRFDVLGLPNQDTMFRLIIEPRSGDVLPWLAVYTTNSKKPLVAWPLDDEAGGMLPFPTTTPVPPAIQPPVTVRTRRSMQRESAKGA